MVGQLSLSTGDPRPNKTVTGGQNPLQYGRRFQLVQITRTHKEVMGLKWFLVLGVTLAVVLVATEARRERTTTPASSVTSAGVTKESITAKISKVRSGLKERVDVTVDKVKVKSRELRMESEKKRVERKLARDQKKADKELKKAQKSEPHNPHNLNMPDCNPRGMVYNGRMCVPPSKMRV